MSPPPGHWRAAVPPSVSRAYRLMITSAVFCVVSLLIVVFTASELRSQLADSGHNDAETYVTTLVRRVAVIELVLAALYVALAGRVLKGSNLARLITGLLTCVVLLGNILLIVQNVSGFASVVAVIWLAVAVALVLALADGAGARYFRPQAGPSAGG